MAFLKMIWWLVRNGGNAMTMLRDCCEMMTELIESERGRWLLLENNENGRRFELRPLHEVVTEFRPPPPTTTTALSWEKVEGGEVDIEDVKQRIDHDYSVSSSHINQDYEKFILQRGKENIIDWRQGNWKDIAKDKIKEERIKKLKLRKIRDIDTEF
jgi:hypothetical protein